VSRTHDAPEAALPDLMAETEILHRAHKIRKARNKVRNLKKLARLMDAKGEMEIMAQVGVVFREVK
jgi:hypothetical protein